VFGEVSVTGRMTLLLIVDDRVNLAEESARVTNKDREFFVISVKTIKIL